MQSYERVAGGSSASANSTRSRLLVFSDPFLPGARDALIQPYSGHASRQSLEVYSRLALAEAQQEYNAVISKFPV
jgi:hypothetical protein